MKLRQPFAGAIASLLVGGRLEVTLDELPFTLERLSMRQRVNLAAAGVLRVLGPGSFLARLLPRAMPVILQVEPTNSCNLRCPACACGAGIMKRAPAMLPAETFEQVIDETKKHICAVFFWSWGEPFLHPHACRMIRYAVDQGMVVHSSTNGNCFPTIESARAVVSSGLQSLVFAVDGLDEPTYCRYRRDGSLSAVLASVRNLRAAKAEAGASNPRLTLRFIVMKHNQHQVSEVERFAAEYGFDAMTLRQLSTSVGDPRCKDELLPDDAASRTGSAFSCMRPYVNLTLFSSGQVVLCEYDFDAERPLGSVFEKPIRQILRGRAMREELALFRRQHGTAPICRGCKPEMRGGGTVNLRTVNLRTALAPKQ